MSYIQIIHNNLWFCIYDAENKISILFPKYIYLKYCYFFSIKNISLQINKS